jgi:flagellar biosynthesis protein
MSKPNRTPGSRVAAALSYQDKDGAPIVTAKGEGYVADEIVKRAVEAGVPVHISRELAALIQDVPLDHPIPPQLYRVIAELLAWVYQLEHRPAPKPEALFPRDGA